MEYAWMENIFEEKIVYMWCVMWVLKNRINCLENSKDFLRAFLSRGFFFKVVFLRKKVSIMPLQFWMFSAFPNFNLLKLKF